MHVPWYEYPQMRADAPGFVERVRREVGGDTSPPVVLICRSGQRTIDAGIALERSGFAQVVNVLHGFEGDLDDNFQRGRLNGRRYDGPPREPL
jgi:rhodanese-related sulfurtransferase